MTKNMKETKGKGEGRKCDYCPSKNAYPLTREVGFGVEAKVSDLCEKCYESGAFNKKPQAAKPSHTPGPLTVALDNLDGYWYVVAPDMTIVAEGIKTEANARLIAAAPDLLAASVALITWFKRPSNTPGSIAPAVEAARAAILRATEGK